jgi:hypothetical protein
LMEMWCEPLRTGFGCSIGSLASSCENKKVTDKPPLLDRYNIDYFW